MAILVDRASFGGAAERIERLGLQPLFSELEAILTGLDLRVEERRDANGAAEIRAAFDARFQAAGGWAKKQTGGRRLDEVPRCERNPCVLGSRDSNLGSQRSGHR
jgi:hypothetical protein